ncbi:MAG: MoaD/ThiS family protein [Pirellulales bacterium]|nr:MoaD/ThiS family protein [Pirellulales bacterium]
MQINVLLFAATRDAAGSDTLQLEVADDARAGDVLDAIARQLPALAALIPSCRLAVDCCYVSADAPISAHCEIALIPPVSGG